VEKYGVLAQPITPYDYPVHGIDNANLDPAITGDELNRFLNFVRLDYIGHNQKKHTAQRNYAMIVLAVTGGMRANELVNLDLDDLRYGEYRVWIRFGKGYKGSGKRQRLTLFTPLAQATLRVYEANTRPNLGKVSVNNRALFLSETGERITYDGIRLALEVIVEAARKAGVELPTPFGWHDLRRSFATEYLEKWPQHIVTLAGYMGHTGLGTLHRYVRPSRKAFQRATNAVIARIIPQAANFTQGE
jgi:integrase